MGDVAQPEHYVYADYHSVLYILASNFNEMITLYEQYYNHRMRETTGSKMKALQCTLQAKIMKMRGLLENYNSVKNTTESVKYLEAQHPLDKIFDLMNEVEGKLTILKWQSMKTCKDAIIKSHFVLGLSAIEKQKESWEEEIAADYG